MAEGKGTKEEKGSKEETKESKKEAIKKPEKKEEPEKEEKSEEDADIISFKVDPWKLTVALLSIGLIISLAFNFLGKGGTLTTTPTGLAALPTDQIKTKVVGYVKALTGVDAVSIKDITENNNLYKITLDISGRVFLTYATLDGNLMFPQAFDLNNIPQPQQQQQQQPSTPPPKSDKPKLEFFVMSFCPFGVQAMNGLGPVARLLGDKVVIEPHYIITVNEDGSLRSLHGEYEANEDIRQVCVWKYHQDKWWDYVDYINANCNKNNLDTCWQEAAENAGLDVDEITTCQDEEGIELMRAEEELSNGYGVRGSPTVFINGEMYSGGRDPEAYKQGICGAFNEVPEECETKLEGSATQASGTC